MDDPRDGYTHEDGGTESFELGASCSCEAAELNQTSCETCTGDDA